ncbi:hypothetical protein [Glycomyces tarimensis]
MDPAGHHRAGPQPPELPTPFLVERIHESAELRAKAETARALGISIKRLDGWEPQTVSWREKRDGRMVTITERETEWDQEQQEWMLALALAEADECPGCHGRLSETTAPEADGVYVPAEPTRCHRCTALGIAADQARDKKTTQPQALFFNVDRIEPRKPRG